MPESPRKDEETKPVFIEKFDVATFEKSIPEELKNLPRWVLRQGKKPVYPKDGWGNPKNLFSFDDVLDAYDKAGNKDGLGIGFIVLQDDGIIFIDFDGCLPKYKEETLRALGEFASWAEVSRSGNGIHILGLGKTDKTGPIKTDLPFGVEIYGGGGARHVAMTGNVYQRYENFGDIEEPTKSFIQKHANTNFKGNSEKSDRTMIPEGGRNNALHKHMCSFYMFTANEEECFTEELKQQGLEQAFKFVKNSMPKPLEPKEIHQVNNSAFNSSQKNFDPTKKKSLHRNKGIDGRDILEWMTEVFLVEEIVFPELGGQVRWLEDTEQWAVFDTSKQGDYHRNQWIINVPSKVKHMVTTVLKDKPLEKFKANYPGVFELVYGDDKASKFKLSVERWAYSYQQNRNINQVVSLFQCEQRISARYSEFDTREVGNYLPVDNGAIDLKTGEIFDITPEMKITRRAGVIGQYNGIRYDPQATCLKWEKFINQITCEDNNLARFLQRLFGYVMSAGNPERKIFTFYGEGRNGKTTLIKIITKIMGEATTGGFSRKIPITALLKKQIESNGEELVLAMKARFAYSSESEDGKTYNQALLKDLSGGGTIAPRQLHVGTLNGEPDFTLVIDTNFPIAFSATDQAMVDRVVQVPFDWRVPIDQINLNLEAELLEERVGILAWMVRGAVEYAQNGLGTCEAVERATKAYVRENNSVAMFHDECIEKTPHGAMGDIQVKEMFEAYVAYCKEQVIPGLKNKTFAKELEKLGCEKKTGTGNRTYWQNVRFKKVEDEEMEGDSRF